MPDVYEEEAARARLYRDNWDRRINFRMEQLQQLAGSRDALAGLVDAWQNIYRTDNFVVGEGDEELEGSYSTPYDSDPRTTGAGNTSSSPVEVAGARHASDQNP